MKRRRKRGPSRTNKLPEFRRRKERLSARGILKMIFFLLSVRMMIRERIPAWVRLAAVW